MVTLSENSAECSSTTPHLESREHFGSNIVSSTNNNNNNEREFNSAAATVATSSTVTVPPPPPPPLVAPPTTASGSQNPHAPPHGIWDLANSEIGYEIAATSGNNFSKFESN